MEKNTKIAAVLVFPIISLFSQGASAQYPDSISIFSKKPVKVAVEVVGLNIGIWAFDRYALKADYAHIGLNSIKHNIKSGFVWDNDRFATNLYGHPCRPLKRDATVHGSALFGWWHLMWEYLMENEKPSINDFITTPIGGVCLGEITFRLSDLLIDNRTSGFERFGSEFLATLISPVRGFNRIISGEVWKIGHTGGHAEKTPSVRFYVTSGYRSLAESRDIHFDNGMYINLKLFYSNVFSEDNEKPYDAFIMNSRQYHRLLQGGKQGL